MRRSLFLASSVAVFFTLVSSCSLLGEVGSGTLIDSVRHSGEVFTQIDNSGIFNIEIVNTTSDPRVVISTDDNIVDYVETEVVGGVLIISIKPLSWIFPSADSKITIYNTQITDFTSSGTGSVTSTDVNTTEALRFVMAGTGSVTLEGSCPSIDFVTSGTGSVHSPNLTAVDVTIEASGTGSYDVFASGSLTGSMSGTGSLRYTGGGTCSVQMTGTGSLEVY